MDAAGKYVSRRNFVKGVAALPFALLLASHGVSARKRPPSVPLVARVRYDLASPQGQEMLQVLAAAIWQMQARGGDDPLSWMWQWYTHFVDGTTTKAAEISRIFGTTVSSQSSLANEVWNTCQSHAGQNANHFLPWHRMFVLYFESIVAAVSARPDFALPYWNYTSDDPAQRGVVPEAFRLPDDPVFGSLYRPDRKALANSGEPIQKFQAGDPMDISTEMAKASYSSSGGVQGFCRALDSGVHSSLHVLVGTAKNMGAVPYAARDPLFWVHHANIDRLWASWNRNGGVNPTSASWAGKTFVFADGSGNRVAGRLKNYFDIDALGYSYDAFIPAPAAAAGKSSALLAQSSANAIPEPVARTRDAAELGARAVHVVLRPVAGSRRTAVLGLDPSQPGKRSYLVLKGLHAWAQPEVLYHVYLTPIHGGSGLNDATYVGSINFFDAEFHDHGNGVKATALGDNFYSFDVTGVLQEIARSGNPEAHDGLRVTFVPGGTPTPGARPLVASIELVRQ